MSERKRERRKKYETQQNDTKEVILVSVATRMERQNEAMKIRVGPKTDRPQRGETPHLNAIKLEAGRGGGGMRIRHIHAGNKKDVLYQVQCNILSPNPRV